MDERSKNSPEGHTFIQMDLNDAQFKNLNPVVQQILQAVRKSSSDVTASIRPEKFGRLTFSEHG
jgi:hypothetical protein